MNSKYFHYLVERREGQFCITIVVSGFLEMPITSKSYINYIFDIDPTDANCMICQICKAKIVCGINNSNTKRHASINHPATVIR